MCVNITNTLNKNGHEATLCATREGGPLEKSLSPDVNFYVLHKRYTADLAAFKRLISIIRDKNIEIIHAHSGSILWAIAAKICVKNLKIIWHDHSGARVTDKQKNGYYKLLSHKTDAIICVNEELAAWSRKHMNVQQQRIVMINNFPLLKIVRSQPDPDVFTIVCLANLRPQKDQETLVRAVALLEKHDLSKRIKVILAGAEDDTGYSRRIRQLISELGLENTIDIPGSVEDTASLLAGADCGVLSSVSEGLPVALLEYGMAALPVVVTNVGQCNKVVGCGRYAKVISAKDVNGMANQLLWVIWNYPEASIMGVRFREHVIKEYGQEKFMKAYTDLLNMINQK